MKTGRAAEDNASADETANLCPLLDICHQRMHLWTIERLFFDIFHDDKTRQKQYIFHRFDSCGETSWLDGNVLKRHVFLPIARVRLDGPWWAREFV